MPEGPADEWQGWWRAKSFSLDTTSRPTPMLIHFQSFRKEKKKFPGCLFLLIDMGVYKKITTNFGFYFFSQIFRKCTTLLIGDSMVKDIQGGE